MERLWVYTFRQNFRVYPPDYPVLLSELDTNTIQGREKMVEVMFETFNVPALYIEKQAVLSLYASGRETGIIVDLGTDQSRIVPILGGVALTNEMGVMNLGGDDISSYFQQLLIHQIEDIEFTNSFTFREAINDIKEKYCFIKESMLDNLDSDNKNPKKMKETYLPNGEALVLKNEQYLAPEILFQPSLIDSKESPLSKLIIDIIDQCDKKIRVDLYQNIVLSGGSSLFPGLEERIKNELQSLRPHKEISIIARPNRRFSAWMGGSTIVSNNIFQKSCMNKKEYLDN